MKKATALLLALFLVVGLCCMPAMASREGKDDPSSNTNVDVNIQLNDSGVTHKYCVDIDYPTSLVFTYTTDGSTWDPNTYTYSEAGGSWSNAKGIKITNHSDLPIQYGVTASVTNSDFADLSIVLGNATGIIGACQVGTVDGSMNATFTVGVSGDPGEALTSTEVKLGHVTIAISKTS